MILCQGFRLDLRYEIDQIQQDHLASHVLY
jgi:hypothetical protein